MGAKNNWHYGIVLDAGSSGSRLHVYRWLSNDVAVEEATSLGLLSLPGLETKDKWTKKTHPGLSSFGPTPSLVGPDHLGPLVEHALEYIPRESVSQTPVFLLATAGMRLLPEKQRAAVLNNVCDYFQHRTDFLVSDCKSQFQVIPGETEGLYGWIAANYLLGGFDAPAEHAHGKGHHTYGFLDMGGASAQIAFAPNATEAQRHANDLTLLRLRSLGGQAKEYRVFVTTWLGFGVREARKRYLEALIKMYKTEHVEDTGAVIEMPDPCLPKGLLMTTEGDILPNINSAVAGEARLIGTGKFDECLHQSAPLLGKELPCLDEPCLLNGVHAPAIDFDVNHFIGISEYWHTTHEIFETGHKDKAYDFNTYQHRVRDFCEQPWSSIQAGINDNLYGKKVDEKTAYEVCFKASWLITVLHDGIGVPRVGIEAKLADSHNGTKAVIETGAEKGYLDPFQAVNKIKSTEISWTMGKMLLYASSDIPVPDGAAPVGFGSNEVGVPADFQYPGGGGRLQQLGANVIDNDQSFTDQIHDTIFPSASPHRIPGFIFFIFILIIGIFCLCGREWRSRLMNYCFESPTKRSRGLGGYLPLWSSRRNINYDRVLESGNNLEDPIAFELDEADFDDDASFTNGKGAAWGSPRRTKLSGSLSPQLVDRRGLVVRTESREQLDLAGGRKSRTTSPTRTRTST